MRTQPPHFLHQRSFWRKLTMLSRIGEYEKTKLATYKAFQEIVEACMDIVAMMCKDSKIPPQDDYTNQES